MREFIALLRECQSGAKVTFAGDYYQVRGFRLGVELGGCRRRSRRPSGRPPSGRSDAPSEVALTLGGLTGFALLNITPSGAPISQLPLHSDGPVPGCT
jgi:hypothetical protein